MNKTLIYIIGLGIIYRTIFAIFLPITLDEAVSYYMTKNSNFYDILSISRSEVIPPITYLIYKFFVFTQSELGVRWIFVVLNLISLFYLFKITKNYFLTILFFIFNTYLSYHGNIARMHSLNIFLSSACCYYFLKIFEDKKISNLLLLIFFSFLMIFNFYPTLALFFSFFVVGMIFKDKMAINYKKFLFFYLMSGIIIFALVIYFVLTSNIQQKILSFRIPSGLISLYIPFSFCFSEIIRYNELRTYKFFLFLTLCVPLIYVFIKAIRTNFTNIKFKILFFSSMLSYLVIFIFSFKMPKLLFSPKYVIFLFPIFLYILILGVERLKRIYKILFIIIFSFLNIIGVYNVFFNNPENWKKIYETVANRFLENDIVLFDAGYLYYPFNFYNKSIPTDNLFKLNPDETKFDVDMLKKHNRIWLVLGHNWGREQKYKNLIISKTFKIFKFFKIGEIEIILFSR